MAECKKTLSRTPSHDRLQNLTSLDRDVPVHDEAALEQQAGEIAAICATSKATSAYLARGSL
jgi:hypothetical protein